MSNDKINWTLNAPGNYTKSLRGYTASIVINASGTATLTITGAGAPAPATYDTRKEAKNAFRKFLFTIPVS
jgi:hypothetical protein